MAIEIPWQQLSMDALLGLIEAYISREGTDYGEYEVTVEQKVEQIQSQLKSGHIVIVFDPDSESCNLLTQQAWQALQARSAEESYFGS